MIGAQSMKLIALAAIAASCACAQDITGMWQGTLETSQRELRIVMKIEKAAQGLKATMYSIDQGGQGIGGTDSMQSPAVKIAIPGIGLMHDGKLDSDSVLVT